MLHLKRVFRFIWNRFVPDFLKPWLMPAPVAAVRPTASSYEGRYIRSFLIVRLFIGGLGVALPVVLVLLDKIAFHGDPFPRGSMSVYYYSGMREVFTVTIGTIAFFLFTYKITEKNLDNTLSVFAGLAGMMIPLFPTGRPSALAVRFPFTDLQKLIGPDHTKWIHYGASAVFIAGLGGVAILFGRREGERPEERDTRFSPAFWRRFHYTCASAIALAAAWIIVATCWKGPYWSLLVGEAVSAMAFGASWFAKGCEIHYILGHDEETRSTAPATSPSS